MLQKKYQLMKDYKSQYFKSSKPKKNIKFQKSIKKDQSDMMCAVGLKLL